MKKEDLNQFKGEIKDALQNWGESKIDAMFPNRPMVKSLLKRGLDNSIVRFDSRINKGLDTAFLFFADSNGVIDSDTMVDMIKDIFKEMDVKTYHFGFVDAVVGKGEAILSVQGNDWIDMLLGDFGSVKFTVDDIDEIKGFIN